VATASGDAKYVGLHTGAAAFLTKGSLSMPGYLTTKVRRAFHIAAGVNSAPDRISDKTPGYEEDAPGYIPTVFIRYSQSIMVYGRHKCDHKPTGSQQANRKTEATKLVRQPLLIQG